MEDNLPTALLEEKNQEIDHLHSEIQRLSEELENTTNDKVISPHGTRAVSVKLVVVGEQVLIVFHLFVTKGFGS